MMSAVTEVQPQGQVEEVDYISILSIRSIQPLGNPWQSLSWTLKSSSQAEDPQLVPVQTACHQGPWTEVP